MRNSRMDELVTLNVEWLRDALELIGRLDDRTYTTSPAQLPEQRAGSHLRHILEFYECLLEGGPSRRVDYDARRRDAFVANSRAAAVDRIRGIIYKLESASWLSSDATILVKAEGGPAWLQSSVSRELQALSSHTIHHFALIAFILRLNGVAVDPEFGVSPSTLQFRAASQSEAA